MSTSRDYTGKLPGSSTLGKYMPALGLSDSGKETALTKTNRIFQELFKPSTSIGSTPSGGSLFTPQGFQKPAGPAAPSTQYGPTQGEIGTGASTQRTTTMAAPDQSLFQEQISPDINPDYSAAIGALNNLQESLRSQLPGMEQQLTNEAEIQRQQVEAERARRQSELEGQAQRESGRTEQNVAEQRRIASELAQGLQARFGATTGTGQFASEILGRESMRGIAESRQAFNDVMRQITDETNKVLGIVQNQLFEIDKNLENAKIDARNNLSQRLAEIDAQKGQLESRKAEMKFDMLKEFAAINADIEARNTAFRQSLYERAQAIQNQYNEFTQLANPDVVAGLRDAGILGDTFQGATANFQTGSNGGLRYAPNMNWQTQIDEQFGVPTSAVGAQG